LPEAQLDRFLMRLSLGYPSNADEVAILKNQVLKHPIHSVQQVVTPAEVALLQQAVTHVYIHDSLYQYIVRVVDATRLHPAVQIGSSPRGSLGLMRGAQALAAIAGRSFAIPDDVKALSRRVLGHRVVVRSDARARGVTPDQVVEEVLRVVPVPVVEGP
ncbi:MAG: MoxR family ATPase, partial [Armatimonadota bacterium]|nr:MoxR family ATPase [Armatimonadota bacterium]